MHNLRQNQTKFIALMLLAISFLAFGGIFVKLSELPPINTGFYRILFAVPFLFPFVYKDLKKLSKKEVGLLLLSGVFLAFDLILWHISFSYTTVANANLLANLVPFTIIPVSYFLFKEKINLYFFIGLVVTLVGIVILVSGKLNPTPDNFIGDLMAFSTSIFYALFMITIYKMRDKIKTTTVIFVSAFGSLPVLAIAMGINEGIYIPMSFDELWPLLALALLCHIGGQGLMAFCLGKVSANLSSVLVLAQPVIAGIYAFILFEEVLSIFEVFGMFVVLAGIYFAKKNA
ncbi:DMT family transporter [Campylobacter fetus]|uniref:DMT family transporter n=1 Tax=Campylobacter fetus TaxID=196 RepID=UPI00081885A5|nr:DMT family transporter [Campylobacter fetus]